MSDPNDDGQLEGSEIAIIGLSGRFPDARNVEEFWENLCRGVESIKVYSDEELLAAGVEPALLKDPNYVKAGAAIDDIELFDAAFFGYSPREAEIMDHQHRLFLEAAWEALEVAGYCGDTYPGAIGVFAGIKNPSSYLLFNILANKQAHESADHLQLIFGNTGDYATTTVSYKLNLRGPSYLIQTACSTSLVAVHVACQSILSGECDMALAGGVSINSKHKRGYLFRDGGIHSPDGHTRAFDEKARGVVGGEGLGIVVLKGLAQALEDGDYLYAVIKGSAINNDGSAKIGYTAPGVEGQASAIAEAQAIARFDPATVTYIETHGTGTVLGDPIEIAALTKAFRARTDRKQFCAIGSVKTNVGHLDAAAGVTGLIKTAMSLDRKMLPPSLFFEKPNPKLDLANSPFFVNSKLSSWETNGFPRRAGVSSFGVGGTNAHVVLEEAPAREASVSKRALKLLVLSARTETALAAATAGLAKHLKCNPTANLADVAYTLQVGRKAFEHRRALVCEETSDAIAGLELNSLTGAYKGTSRQLVMMFSGQGTQYINMTRGIYQDEPAFRDQVDQCAALLEKYLQRDLREILYPAAGEDAELLKQTQLAQPALFVVEYALARMLMKWGLEPQALIGHSIGEYVAACLSGVLSLEDALAVVAARGRLMQEMPAGAMLAVHLAEADARELLSSDISLAAVNAPSLSVISGGFEAIDRVERNLSGRGVGCRRLHTSHAFHSHMMEPVCNRLAGLFSKIDLKAPKIPYISNVTGDWITPQQAVDPDYWGLQLRGTVQFAHGLNRLVQDGPCVFVEVGPGQTLLTFARQCAGQNGAHAFVATMPHRNEQEPDAVYLMKALGSLWVEGQEINWNKFHDGETLHRVPLPTYPFERQRYWIEPSSHEGNNHSPRLGLDKNPDLAEWCFIPSWKRSGPISLRVASGDKNELPAWLIFIDECGVGEKMVQLLLENGYRVVTVRKGDLFSKEADAYTINPALPLDYESLLGDLDNSKVTITRVVHLWSVNTPALQSFEISHFELAQETGFYSLLYLSQALAKFKPTEPLSIGVVSNNLHEVTGEETIYPEKATILSFCKIIPKEFAGVYCRAIDIVLPGSGTTDETTLVQQLVAEFDRRTPEQVIAYRGRHRWVQTYESMRLDEGTLRLREKGVYLITGGLGGVGLALAEHLAETVSAKLVLIGRTGLPAEQDWERWLSEHDEENQISTQITKILTLRELGAEVLVIKADVSSLESMSAALDQAEERFGRIHGVIHAAGVMGGGLMQLKTKEMVQNVLLPKAGGTLVLHKLFEKKPLDFWLLCSSITAVTGGLGQIDYCAANSFLDAYAHSQSGRSNTVITSVNFPAWKETGMALNASRRPVFGDLVKHDLEKGMLTSEAIEVCRRILSSSVLIPQVVVSTQHLGSLLQQHLRQTGVGGKPETAARQPEQNLTTYPRPNLKNEYVPPETDTEKIVVNYWEEVIGIDRIGIHDNFLELGGHSLMAVQLLSRLRDRFQVELPLRSFFDSPTVAELVQLIEHEQSVEVEAIPLIAHHSQTLDDLMIELEEQI